MEILEAVKQNYDWISTEWSIIYNLNDFTMDIAVDQDYKTVHKLTADDFR